MSQGTCIIYLHWVQTARVTGVREQGSYRLPGEPRVLATEQIFSVSMFQSQVGELITEVALIVDIRLTCTLRVGIWAVGKGSCLPEPQGRLPGRGVPGLKAQM